MADRRMFAKSVVDSDKFLDMPISTQALYFHLGMRADDDGFVNSPKLILRLLNCSEDDLRVLTLKNFIVPFESGVIVINDWNVNNKLRADRRKPTIFTQERSSLMIDEIGRYHTCDGHLTVNCPSNDGQTADTRPPRIDKNSIDKAILCESEYSAKAPVQEQNKGFGEYQHVFLTDTEYKELLGLYGENLLNEYIKRVDLYCEAHGKSYPKYCALIKAWITQDGAKARNDDNSNFDVDEWYRQAESIDFNSISWKGDDNA